MTTAQNHETSICSESGTGRWPEELRGVLYYTEPVQYEANGWRNRHWFDGDGLVHAYRIGADGVRHEAKLAELPYAIPLGLHGKFVAVH